MAKEPASKYARAGDLAAHAKAITKGLEGPLGEGG